MAIQGNRAVQVKVCGLTRRGDVEACETLGVDWAGFNFWPKSKRHITPDAARPLVAALRKCLPVGVFVNPTREEVLDVIRITGIQYVQLHGDEDWALIASLPVPVIKALPADRLDDWQGLADDLAREPDKVAYLLVDAPAGSDYGGTGRTFEWSRLGHIARPRPLFLAGGLGPQNVAEAVAQVRPMAVDLNSKVESAPGQKDAHLIAECLRQLGR